MWSLSGYYNRLKQKSIKSYNRRRKSHFLPQENVFLTRQVAGFYGKKHFLAGGNVTLGNIFSRTKMFSCDRHPMGG